MNLTDYIKNHPMIASTDYKEKKKKQDYMNSFQTRFAQTFYKLQVIII